MQHYIAGLGPGAPFGYNTKAPARLQNVAPRRLPHSGAKAEAAPALAAALPAAEAAAAADRPATPEARGSGKLSAQEERLRWLDARLSKLNARRAKVIADESRLQQQFKELAELRSVGDNIL